MTRADRKNAVLRKTRLKFQQQIAAAGRPPARNYEALSKTCYNSVRISNFGLKFLQYILNILHFRSKQKKIFDFSNPSYQTTTLTIIVLRLKKIRYCSIVARGSLKTLAYHSLRKYWMQKIQKP